MGWRIIPFAISMTIYCLLIAAVFVMTLVVTIQRFNKNLLGDEGYLSFTLPVKVTATSYSKMIISLMWTVLSVNRSNSFCPDLGSRCQHKQADTIFLSAVRADVLRRIWLLGRFACN